MDDRVSNGLAAAVTAIGTAAFPEKLLAALQIVAGTDLCSAFEQLEDGSLRYLFAAGMHPDIPGFAESASLAYARLYWQRDRTTQRALALADGRVHVVRQAWNGISDPDYRRACYERGGIVERLTLYSGTRPGVFASAYRMRDSGHSAPDQVEALEGMAGLLLAIVASHAASVDRAGRDVPAPLQAMSHRLLACGRELSPREAAVAAGMLLGRTQGEIAEAAGLAVSSVITYRRRAYRKLGVADRRGLVAFLETLEHRH